MVEGNRKRRRRFVYSLAGHYSKEFVYAGQGIAQVARPSANSVTQRAAG